MLAHPNARVDGNTVSIPTYDPNTDTAGEIKLELYDDPPAHKLTVGTILEDPRNGNRFTIVDFDGTKVTGNDPIGIKVRVGRRADWNEGD